MSRSHLSAIILSLCLVWPLITLAISIDIQHYETHTLPVPSGKNAIVDVIIKGQVKKAWLSPSKNGTERFPLSKSGDYIYQINLADPEVTEALLASSIHQFYIHVNDAEGEEFISIPMAYKVTSGALDEQYKPTGAHSFSRMPQKLTMAQRSRANIPDTSGKLRIDLGDISDNKAVFDISSRGEYLWNVSNGGIVLAPYESMVFDDGNIEFRILLAHLDNSVFGTDYATFFFLPMDLSPSDKRRILSGVMQASDLKVRHDGQWLAGRSLIDTLSKAYPDQSLDDMSISEWLDAIRQYESDHKPFLVGREPNQTTLVDWLINIDKQL